MQSLTLDILLRHLAADVSLATISAPGLVTLNLTDPIVDAGLVPALTGFFADLFATVHFSSNVEVDPIPGPIG